MASFGRLNAFLGMMAVGAFLILAGALIGISELFANYAWYEGASLIVIGVFLLALALIGLIGGVEKP